MSNHILVEIEVSDTLTEQGPKGIRFEILAALRERDRRFMSMADEPEALHYFYDVRVLTEEDPL